MGESNIYNKDYLKYNYDQYPNDLKEDFTSATYDSGKEFTRLQERCAESYSSAYDTCHRNDFETAQGECLIREALATRQKAVLQWQRNLKDEIDSLAKEHLFVEDHLRDVVKALVYFQNISRVSDMCSKFRSETTGIREDSVCNKLLQQELFNLQACEEEMKNQIGYLKSCLSKLEETRNCLMSDLHLKLQNFIGLKSCDHAKPLLSKPYEPNIQKSPCHPDTEEQWDYDVNDHIQHAIALRRETHDCSTVADNTILSKKADMATMWYKTNNAFSEEIYQDECAVKYLQKSINQIDKDIHATRLRISTFCDEHDIQERQKMLDNWRLQRLSFRPTTEHIKDRAVQFIEKELKELDDRMDSIVQNFKNDEKLLEDLLCMKKDFLQELDNISKRLFANRENCEGIRRTVTVERTRDLSSYC